jgi:cupin 2 domain-containing protein
VGTAHQKFAETLEEQISTLNNLAAGNIFSRIPADLPEEKIDLLLQAPGLRLERIISAGQATPKGQWYDQDSDEWVVLLAGRAGLLFENEAKTRIMEPGDWVLIPAHCRHRVEWTDAAQKTVWLALHHK